MNLLCALSGHDTSKEKLAFMEEYHLSSLDTVCIRCNAAIRIELEKVTKREYEYAVEEVET